MLSVRRTNSSRSTCIYKYVIYICICIMPPDIYTINVSMIRNRISTIRNYRWIKLLLGVKFVMAGSLEIVIIYSLNPRLSPNRDFRLFN